MVRTVIFAGHFAVGTRPAEVERRTLDAAAARDGDLAVLVNDMGFFRRTILYDSYGAPALLREVRRAPRCGTTFSCAADVSAVGENMDWAAYDSARARLAGCPNAAVKRDALRGLVGDLVAERIASHGLEQGRVRIFYERQLRNAASARLRNRTVGGAASWRAVLQEAGLLEDVLVRLSRIPTCGAILLALYERLIRLGYGRVVQLYDVADRIAIENGERLFRVLSDAKGWPPLQIESSFYATQDDAALRQTAPAP